MKSDNSSIILLFAIIGLSFWIGVQDIHANRLPIVVPGITSAHEPYDSYELNAAEGMVAIDVVVNKDNNDEEITEECKCNGTKRVRTPDGLSTIPCPCGKDCTCKRPHREEPPVIEPQVTIPPEVKVDPIPPVEPPPVEPEETKDDEVQQAPTPKFEQKKEYKEDEVLPAPTYKKYKASISKERILCVL